MGKIRYAAALITVCALLGTALAGTVTEKTFQSQALGGQNMTYYLYLPSDYEQKAQAGTKFSVVYLLHWWLYWAKGWHESDGNRINPQTDKAIDSVPDIIAVAPQDETLFNGMKGTSWWIDSPANPSWKYGTFLTQDLKNEIDATCSTYTDKGHTGVCGVSMGGFGTLYHIRVNKAIYGVGYAVVPCCNMDAWDNPVCNFGLCSVFGNSSTAAYDPMKHVSEYEGLKFAFYTGNCDQNTTCPSGYPNYPADPFFNEIGEFHAALEQAGVEHTYTSYSDDAHEYPTPAKMAMILRFFAQNFGTVDIAQPGRSAAVAPVPGMNRHGAYIVLKNSRLSGRESRKTGLDGKTISAKARAAGVEIIK